MFSKADHIQAIKKRLCEIVGKMTLNQLKGILEEKTNFDYHYDTIRNTFSNQSNALDVMVISAVARVFNVDIAQILALPGENIDNLRESYYGESKAQELNDPRYFGKTYGYLYSNRMTRTDIDSFCLDIRRVGQKTYATFKLNYHSTKDGQTVIQYKEFTGEPFIVGGKSIYIVMQDSVGDILNLSYSYVRYNWHQLYFRKGTVVTRAREAHRSPLMQSFVMFDAPIAKTEMKYVPGFLVMADGFDLLHIPVRKFNDLCAADQDVMDLCNGCKYLFSDNHTQYHAVSENQLFINSHGIMERERAIRAVLLIKGIAEAPIRVSFPENDELSDFSRSLEKEKVT